jgi:capsular polysaccharide export protein
MHGPIPFRRKFLFLQGMATPFFAKLASALAEQGHEVRRINFNGGDRLFWRLPGAVDYRGDLENWPPYLSHRIRTWGITDIVLFGDCRPLHRVAIRIGRWLGIPVHVFEEGYIRPNWITLEKDGVNGNSRLPRDPQFFRAAAGTALAWDGGVTVRSNFVQRAIHDVVYNLATAAMTWRYPQYRTHRPSHPLVEYMHGARRFLRKPIAKRHARKMSSKLSRERRAYYVFPLQLESDAQVRHHSKYAQMEVAIAEVISSFSRYAPKDTLLVITEHPLDTSKKDWSAIVRSLAAESGIGGRVIVLEGGSPEELIRHSLGVPVVNSTVGYIALSFGIPVVALGVAIYDMPGLTYQDGLDHFWADGTPPDFETFDAFRRVIAERTQVNGGFFSAQGLALAVHGAAARLVGDFVSPLINDSHSPRRIVGPRSGAAALRKTAQAG